MKMRRGTSALPHFGEDMGAAAHSSDEAEGEGDDVNDEESLADDQVEQSSS